MKNIEYYKKIMVCGFLLLLFLPHGIMSQDTAKNNTHADNIGVVDDKDATDDKKVDIDPFDFGAVIQGGLLQNFRGGIETGFDYMGRVHLTLSFDTEKANLWKGGKFFVNGVNAHGGIPTATLIGDFQPISRNEATERTALFEFWYQQTIGNTSILVGQHDMNSSFGTSGYGGHSINSAFGMYPSITPNTGFAFSIYPRTMPAIYLKHEREKFTFQVATYAGASEDFESDRYNVKWNLDDSRFIVGEIHYKSEIDGIQKGLYKLGVIHHSGQFSDVTDIAGSATTDAGMGFYLIADHLLIPESEYSDQGLGMFFETGFAPGKHNLVDQFWAGGIVYKGLFNKRDKDELFFGILNSSINNEISEISSYDEDSRTTLELNYAIKLGSHFTFQPDLQYIVNPGASSLLDNAFLGVLRFSINY